MAKSVSQRVHDAFAGDSIADLKGYEDKVLASWKDVSSSLSRSVVLILTVIVIFELLAYQNSSRVFTIGSISFADTSTVQMFLPTIVAYSIYDGCRLTLRWMDLQAAYIVIAEKCLPTISDNDIDLLIAPTLPTFWAVGKRLSVQNCDRGEKFALLVNMSLASMSVIILPVGFEVQAYYHLFAKFGGSDVLLWANAGTTSVFLLSAVTYMVLRGD